MKVGDLVKIYHFSFTARKHYKTKTDGYIPDDLDGYFLGLIVGETRNVSCHDWVVLLSCQREIFHENRLEVINESR